jgi:fluoride exporter
MLSYIFVMLGGALGTGARFWMSGFVAERAGEFFPLGTLVVNVSGSLSLDSLLPLQVRKGRSSCRRDSGNSS